MLLVLVEVPGQRANRYRGLHDKQISRFDLTTGPNTCLTNFAKVYTANSEQRTNGCDVRAIAMRKQLDNRIPILINNNVKKNHRSFIVLVGDRGRDQVRMSFHLPEQSADLQGFLGCEPALLAFTSTSICTSIRVVVL